MAKRLWDKGDQIDAIVHDFTVGSDPEIDKSIARWDVVASAAHADMLATIGILSESDLASLRSALREAHAMAVSGTFDIPRELEDCHTTLESFLVERLGETGRRIHAGRSRNDQVLVAVRLMVKDRVINILGLLAGAAHAFLERANDFDAVPLPGYTHMQPAMPSGVDMWCQAFAEWAIELIGDGVRLLESIDSNPLGVGSGFGVTLPLDRHRTSDLLGFNRVQRNPIHVQNSRGRMELKALRWIEDISGMVEKFAWDAILFASREYGFLKLPVAFTTGSSIMPQKRNPDVLELMRGSAARTRACAREVEYVTSKLPSSYHRDFQLTKEPVVRSFALGEQLVTLLTYVASKLDINRDRIEGAMTDDLYATFDVFRQVAQGAPFRDAYKATASRLGSAEIRRQELEQDYSMIQDTVRRERATALSELATLEQRVIEARERLDKSEKRSLSGD